MSFTKEQIQLLEEYKGASSRSAIYDIVDDPASRALIDSNLYVELVKLDDCILDAFFDHSFATKDLLITLLENNCFTWEIVTDNKESLIRSSMFEPLYSDPTVMKAIISHAPYALHKIPKNAFTEELIQLAIASLVKNGCSLRLLDHLPVDSFDKSIRLALCWGDSTDYPFIKNKLHEDEWDLDTVKYIIYEKNCPHDLSNAPIAVVESILKPYLLEKRPDIAYSLDYLPETADTYTTLSKYIAENGFAKSYLSKDFTHRSSNRNIFYRYNMAPFANKSNLEAWFKAGFICYDMLTHMFIEKCNASPTDIFLVALRSRVLKGIVPLLKKRFSKQQLKQSLKKNKSLLSPSNIASYEHNLLK